MQKKVIVLGATVLGLGVASVFKENCTVINKGYNFAYEYADAYKVHKINLSSDSLDETKDFVNNLKSANLINSDGLIHPLYLQGFAAKYLKNSGASVYLGASVEKIIEDGERVKVTFYINGEQITKSADFLIDTTDFGNYKKSLYAMLYPEKDFSYNLRPSLIKGRFDKEYYIKIDSFENESYQEAFMRINDLWKDSLCRQLPEFRLASVANCFANFYEKPVVKRESQRILKIPSASFADAAKSFEEGIKCCSLI